MDKGEKRLFDVQGGKWSLRQIIRGAGEYHKHAQGCKVSPPADCKRCAKGMEFFRALPLHVLSIVLGEV